VNEVKTSYSAGFDEISSNLIKKVIDCIAEPLCAIFNISLTNGVFPEQMKLSKVCPIFKSGDKTEFTNYRPISLLPTFSKIL